MKIALAQMRVIPARPDKNLETMLRMKDDAIKAGADMVVFPEMTLPGYLIGDLFTQEAFVRDSMEYDQILKDASNDIAIAYGNVFAHDQHGFHPNRDGRTRKYNAVRIFQNGKEAPRLNEHNYLPAGVQPKTLLPTYRIFDDDRYFMSLIGVAQDAGVPLERLMQPYVITDKEGNKIPVGFETCEDLWCEDYRKNGAALNPTKMLVDNGAKIIVNLSASPWTFGKNKARDRRVEFLRKDVGEQFPRFLYVNIVGTQNNGKNIVTFDGGTTVYDEHAKPIQLLTEQYQEGLFIHDTAQTYEQTPRVEKPEVEQRRLALVEGIRHVPIMQGREAQPKYVIGLSGGIDSAIVAALLVDAVGADNVFAVNLPTQYNSAKTKGAAAHVARELGIRLVTVPIQELSDMVAKTVQEADIDGKGRILTTLNHENIQAKIRGVDMQSNLAAAIGGLFTNNGNKVEMAFNYNTLYGDMSGAIAVLGDQTKTDVVALANHYNAIYGREVIPKTLIPDELFRFGADQIKPSAELKEAQFDPMKFGYHCKLITAMTDYRKAAPADVMQWYKDGVLAEKLHLPAGMIERWGLTDPKVFVPDLEELHQRLYASVFKRVQAPPVIITSKTAFGYDLRESQIAPAPTRAYLRLKQDVLAMQQYVPATARATGAQ